MEKKQRLLFYVLMAWFFILPAYSAYSADIEEVLITNKGHLVYFLINFDPYQIKVDSTGHIMDIDILLDITCADNYYFRFKKITLDGRFEFLRNGSFFNWDTTIGYTGFEHWEMNRIQYYPFMKKVWRIDTLTFRYDAYNSDMLRQVGDVLIYYDLLDKSRLERLGNFRCTYNRDDDYIRLNKDIRSTIPDSFTVRIKHVQ